MEENHPVKNNIITEEPFNFRDTKATEKIFSLKKRIRAVQGGTSASKTISILVWIIDYCQTNQGKKFDIMSESYPHLEDGAIKDFTGIMTDRGYWDDKRWNSTKHIYTFETGTILKFISVDKFGKAKGPRRDGLFLNECNHLSWQIVEQLEVRTSEIIWMDWNPDAEFWYHDRIKDKVDHDFIILTYLDCINVLPKSIIESIESKKYNKTWWKVYGLGQLGIVETRIYKNWEPIDEIPKEALIVRRGLDFGYTNDPAALCDIYKWNGAFIIDETLYRKGMKNRHIADVIKGLFEPETLVIADSAEPKSIDDLAEHDINIVGATKGPDSIKNGTEKVQSVKIFVTKRSVHIWREYRRYLWKQDKDGRILNVPEDGQDDHLMDAIRYAISSMVHEKKIPKRTKKITIPESKYEGTIEPSTLNKDDMEKWEEDNIAGW